MVKNKSGPGTIEEKTASALEPVKEEPTFTKAQLIGSKHFQHRRDALQAVLDDGKRYTVKQAQAGVDGFLRKKVR